MMNLMAEETKSSEMEQGLKLTGQRSEENRIAEENIMLKEENQRLQKENEALLGTVTQMKVTLNRLIKRYIIAEGPKH